jgi:hypothetical protein
MGIHTKHNTPVALAVAVAVAAAVAAEAAVAALAAVAATVAAAVAGEAAKDLGRIRPAKDLGCRVGRDRGKTAKDLGRGSGLKNVFFSNGPKIVSE